MWRNRKREWRKGERGSRGKERESVCEGRERGVGEEGRERVFAGRE